MNEEPLPVVIKRRSGRPRLNITDEERKRRAVESQQRYRARNAEKYELEKKKAVERNKFYYDKIKDIINPIKVILLEKVRNGDEEKLKTLAEDIRILVESY